MVLVPLHARSRNIIILSVRCSSYISKDDDLLNSTSKSENVKPFKNIPGPLRIPIWGNLYQYKFGSFDLFKYHKVLENLYVKYGPVVRQDIGSNIVIHIFNPEDIKTVYLNEGTTPHVMPLQETAQFYRKERQMSPGLGNVNGDEWYRLRSAVRQMMLRPREVHYYLPFIQEVASDFVQQIDIKKNHDDIVENLRDEVAKWSQESSGMVCFETRLGCMDGGDNELRAQQMVDSNKLIFLLSALLKFSLPIYKYVSTPKWKKLVNAEDYFYRTATGYATDTIDKINDLIGNNNLSDGKYSFMTYLLSKEELSKKDVIILTFSLFADGLTTTVPALLYNLYCLSVNKDAQDKAYEEIKIALKHDNQITVQVLNKLPYLKAVVKETFRLYPIGTEVSRITQKHLVLGGYHVPKGTHMNLTPNVHFCSNDYFTDPTHFKPERWIRGGEANIHPYLLTPFGHGTRTCAGRRFAEQDLYVVLCRILQKYELRYADKKPLEQIYNTLLFPDGPLGVQFVDRAS